MYSRLYSILILAIIFTLYTYTLLILVRSLPPLDDVDSEELNFPKDLDQLRRVVYIFHKYKQDHYLYVLILFSIAYLYKQTFSIPGSVFTNVLAGAIFGVWPGFLLASVLTACGATSCFLMSKFLTRTIVVYYFPEKVKQLQDKVKQNSNGLFFFLLSLRLFPMSPNWFMNIAFPLIGIPINYFFLSVLIGLMPYNYICCQAGLLLSQMTSIQDLLHTGNIVGMISIACIAALPGVVIRYTNKKIT